MKKYKEFFHKESGITFTNFQQVREYIWYNREHKSEVSGKPLHPLGSFWWTHQFAHLLNRHHTHFVLNPDNVMLLLPDEHSNQESYPLFMKRQEEMRRKYYQEFYNKQF
jgi:hypothetical protein